MHDEQIRIMQVITRLNIGGPSVVALLTAAHFNNDRYSSTAVTGVAASQEGDMLDAAAGLGVTPIVIPELQREVRPLKDLTAFWKLFRLIRKQKVHVVHTHMSKAGALGRLAAWLNRTPAIVHTYHGHVFEGYFSPGKTWLIACMERLAGRLTDRVLVLSEIQRRQICERYRIVPPDKVSVVRLGFDLALFDSARREAAARGRGMFREKHGIPQDAFLVGIVGRLAPIKDHGTFLLAAEQICRHQPDRSWKFALVGDGELRYSLEQEAQKLGIEDRIVFTGWEKEMAHVYPDLDLLVLTSRNEGTPVAVIEAMAAGRAVIATAVGGVPEVLIDGETGLLIPPQAPDVLAEKILLLAGDPDLRLRLGQKAREHVMACYDRNRLLSELERVYQELLARSAHKLVK